MCNVTTSTCKTATGPEMSPNDTMYVSRHMISLSLTTSEEYLRDIHLHSLHCEQDKTTMPQRSSSYLD